MSYASDLTAAYAAHGETVMVNGDTVFAFFDTGYADALEVAGQQPSLRCIAADVAGVAAGDPVVRAGTNYTVRNLLQIAPDGLELRLVLELAE